MQQWYQCPRCGAPVAFGVRFCGNCQTPLNWPTQQSPQQQYQQTPQYQQQPPQYQQPEPPKKKSKLGLILLAVVLFALAAVGSCVVCVMQPSSSESPAPKPTDIDPEATFTITKFDQDYVQSLNEWSKYAYIYFDVENKGIVYLAYYKIYFTVTYDDGSTYQDWTIGKDVLVGQKWSYNTIEDVGSKKVVSVEITNWELTAGTPPEIIYEITGTADEVDVTLNNDTGGTEQYDNVSIPKKYSYDSFTDNFLYISAQNQGKYGTVTVSIYVNGKVVKTSSSSGAYVIASASASK
jgi:hypothetical protein